MVDSTSFRDKHLDSVLIGYDWADSAHFAEISVSAKQGSSQTFRINGLTAYYLNEDFAAQYISHSTLS